MPSSRITTALASRWLIGATTESTRKKKRELECEMQERRGICSPRPSKCACARLYSSGRWDARRGIEIQNRIISRILIRNRIKSRILIQSRIESRILIRSRIKSRIPIRSRIISHIQIQNRIKSRILILSRIKSCIQVKNRIKSRFPIRSRLRIDLRFLVD